jgi:signal peptidase I
MDFATILTLAVIVTGLIWLVDAVWFARRRRPRIEELRAQGADEAKLKRLQHGPLLVEYARAFFPVLLVVLLIRSFGVEPFRIPSGSMMPTLLVGDFILVNKFSYGIRLPVINTKVISVGEPKRGDVVVFRFPDNPSVDYIKRVVGLPGDLIGYFDKTVYVNGKAQPQKLVGAYDGDEAKLVPNAVLRKEDLSGVNHSILLQPWKPSVEGTFRVPEGHYFVMGDNRDNSNDSRYWGTVPEQNLVGKAFLVWMNWSSDNGGIDMKRIGRGIH